VCRSDSMSFVCSDVVTPSWMSLSFWISKSGMSISCCSSKSVITVMMSGRWDISAPIFVCVVPCSSGNIWNVSEFMENPVVLCSNPLPVSDRVRSTCLLSWAQRRVIYCWSGKW